MKRIVLTFSLLVLSENSEALPKDQCQPDQTGATDTSQGMGQTFVAGLDGLLLGVRVKMQRMGDACDLYLRLHHIDPKSNTHAIISSNSFFNGSSIAPSNLLWYTIYFTQPYSQSEGEALAFSFTFPSTSSRGFNLLAMNTNAPYSAGTRAILQSNGTMGEVGPPADLVFETLVLPTPKISNVLLSGSSIIVASALSYTDIVYTLECCTNLLEETWLPYTTTTGVSSIEWTFPQPTNKCMFYRIKATE